MKTKILAFLFFAAFSPVCLGDVIHLTNGGKLKGTVVEEDGDRINVKLDSGGVTYLKKELVKKIECTAVPDAEKAIDRAEELQKEAEIDVAREDFGAAVAKYDKAIRQCGLVRKKAGKLWTKAAFVLSSELKEQLVTVRNELVKRGDEQLALKEYERAILYYKATIIKGDIEHTQKIGKKVLTVYLPLADACFNEKNYERSIRYYSECLFFAPESSEMGKKLADAYLLRGIAFYEKRKNREATRDMRACLQLVPSNTQAGNYLLMIHAETLSGQAAKDKEKGKYSAALNKYVAAGKVYKGLLDKETVLPETLKEKISSVEENIAICKDLAFKNIKLPAVWTQDYQKAIRSAKKYERPILINFTGSDWCHWCKKLKAEVFSRRAFQNYASERLILLEIDFPSHKSQSAKQKEQNQSLSRKYGIKGYPTVILADADGKVIAKTGYKEGGADKYVGHLKKILSR